MRILVTGGAGFIGSNLVDALADNNEVTVVDNLHTGVVANVPKKAKFIEADVKALSSPRFRGYAPDVIYHIGIYSSTPMYRDNRALVGEVVDGMISVMEFAKNVSARVVIASSSSIYNGYNPPHCEDMVPLVTDYYTEARIAVERLAALYGQMYGVDAACLRFFSVYGHKEEHKKQYANLVSQFLWALRKKEAPVIYGDGSQTRDFTYVDDVVTALQKAVGRRGNYNVGTGMNYSVSGMLEKLCTALDVSIKPVYVANPLKNYVECTQADTTKSERELGFKARYTLDEGIQKLIN